MNSSLDKIDARLYFFLLCFFECFLAFVYRDLLIYDNLYYEAYGEQLAFERIEKMLDFQQQYQWIIYLIIPVFMLLKIFLVACCLNIGAILERYEISFGSIFKVSLLAETVYLAPLFIKIIYFLFFASNYTLEELGSFNPFSILSLFDMELLEFWQVVLLGIFNLFELLYVLLLAYCMQSLLQKNYVQSLGFVGLSYGAGLFSWLIFLMFLQLMLQS